MKNTLFALLNFVLLSTPLATTAQESGDFTYTSNGSAITITRYSERQAHSNNATEHAHYHTSDLIRDLKALY